MKSRETAVPIEGLRQVIADALRGLPVQPGVVIDYEQGADAVLAALDGRVVPRDELDDVTAKRDAVGAIAAREGVEAARRGVEVDRLRGLLWRFVDAPVQRMNDAGDMAVVVPRDLWNESADAVGYDEMGG